MNLLEFDTVHIPAEHRLDVFRAGAADFTVAAVGDPADFCSRWSLLKLGDVNAIRSSVSPVHYRRDQAMIDAGGEDRVAIHYYVTGGAGGVLDGRPVAAGAGGAMVWDLAHPLDITTTGALDLLILTLPRFMLDEVVASPSFSAALPPTPALALAARQLAYMIDHAADLPDAGAAYLGRALRDLFVVAMLPSLRVTAAPFDPSSAPLFLRLCAMLDRTLQRDPEPAEVAGMLDAPVAAVLACAAQAGGLGALAERRRLLAAYRLLSDPAENAPVSTIAWRCGFTTTSRFSRRFRDVFHTTPSALRRARYGDLPPWAGAYHVERDYSAFASRG